MYCEKLPRLKIEIATWFIYSHKWQVINIFATVGILPYLTWEFRHVKDSNEYTMKLQHVQKCITST